jgi:putative endonuclease
VFPGSCQCLGLRIIKLENFFLKIGPGNQKISNFAPGEMAEWSIAAVLKTVEPRGSGGSNPSFSAFARCSELRRTKSEKKVAKESSKLKPVTQWPVFLFTLVFMWTVYILKCNDGTYYVGCTNNIEDRIRRHNKGDVHYTASRLPFEIVHQSVFYDKYKAYDFEKCLKSGSGRAFAIKRLHSF